MRRRRSKKKSNRRVAKDKTQKTVPKKYLTGTKGAARSQRARDIARMQRLYKAGKKVPKSLFKRIFG
jgi:peptide subunit release factor 1 (eRF1)|tara:strand:- start:420 stop:620 length:201 start_codon:yes stop_codon:yes gene_type:complete